MNESSCFFCKSKIKGLVDIATGVETKVKK